MERGHQMMTMGLRQQRCFGSGLVKVFARLDHVRAQCPHRGVFLRRITDRHHNADRQPHTPRRQRKALPVVTARGGHQTSCVGFAVEQALYIQQPAAHFERAGRGVVFMFDPHLRPQPFGQ